MDLKLLLLKTDNFADFLDLYCKEKRSSTRYFSIRQLAQKMGYKTPSLLSDVILKKRSPSVDILNRFIKAQDVSLLEKQFLDNLIMLEISTSTDIKNLAKKENDLIRRCWDDSSELNSPEMPRSSALDITIMGKLGDSKGISAEELVKHYRGLISPSTVLERLNFMLENGDVQKDADGKLIRGKKENMSRADSQSFLDLRDLIEAAATREGLLRQQSILTLHLSENKFKKASEILKHACYNIYMLALEEHQDPNPEPGEIYTLYSIFFQTTNVDK